MKQMKQLLFIFLIGISSFSYSQVSRQCDEYYINEMISGSTKCALPSGLPIRFCPKLNGVALGKLVLDVFEWDGISTQYIMVAKDGNMVGTIVLYLNEKELKLNLNGCDGVQKYSISLSKDDYNEYVKSEKIEKARIEKTRLRKKRELEREKIETESGGGDGETNQSGGQGKTDGDKSSKNYSGGGNGDGLTFSLAGRSMVKSPTIRDKSQEEGKVVVDIIVDKYGNVIRASPGARGSTTASSQLYKIAKEAALKTKFNANRDAREEQIGKMTFIFTLN